MGYQVAVVHTVDLQDVPVRGLCSKATQGKVHLRDFYLNDAFQFFSTMPSFVLVESYAHSHRSTAATSCGKK